MAEPRTRASAGQGRRLLLGAGGLLLFFLLWEVAVRSGLLTSALVPAPSSIPGAFAAEIRRGVWLRMIRGSLSHYSRGLLAGSLLGVAVGAAGALSPLFRDLHAWLARLLRPIPPLAWIPFAIVWFGISGTAASFIIGIGVFWINYFAAGDAIRRVDPDFLEVARAFGHRSFGSRLRRVVLPASLPGIVTGLRTGLGMGWMTVVAAELFGIAGIGQRMMEASGLLATEIVVVYMLTIAMLYGLTDAIFGLIQRRLLSWLPSSS